MDQARAKNRYLHAIQQREPARPDWAEAIRRRGADRFAKLDWPHHRQEAWRFTDVTPVVQGEFDLQGAPKQLARADIAVWSLDEAETELVFVDGRYANDLSKLAHEAWSLAAAIETGHEAVRRHLDNHIEPSDAFAALNGALFRDGPFVHVPKGGRGKLVHVLHVSTGGIASHPRGLIVVERGAECRVVETYAALNGDAYLTNSVAEIVLEEGARLDYAKVVVESDAGHHLGATQVVLGGGSRFNANCVTLGGNIVRNALNVAIEGEGAETFLRGLYIADADRLTDNALFVDHAKPRCLSRIAYRGILNDAGRAVFTGSVLVEHGAQKTDSNTVNNNLILSDAARVDTKPQLKILADDVKCTHGATIGQHSPEAIYYFKTRGIDEATAHRMLTCGFAAEILRGLKVQSLEDRLTKSIFAKFGG